MSQLTTLSSTFHTGGNSSTRRVHAIAACLLVLPLVLLPSVDATEQFAIPGRATQLELGRRIYVEGILPSGAALTGTRFGNATVSGADSACVNCHRPSGMGEVEGDIQVPPITGKFLFSGANDKQLATMDPRVSKEFNKTHAPYTQASLAAAIRHGVNVGGRDMDVAMPRYNLTDSDLQALSAYLGQLSAEWSPGVTRDEIRFATVITPDVDPARRKALLDMMQTIIRQKNASTQNSKQGYSRHHMTSAAELILGTERTWDLDIWELKGAPDTWGEQLRAQYLKNPVFALISGASFGNWQPVHDFCNTEQVPCWFPSVDVPSKANSPYSFYFSGGVTLEANVLARHLLTNSVLPKRLIQVFRTDTAGQAAAQELKHALEGSAVTVEDREIGPEAIPVDAFGALLGHAKKGDVVVYWLRQDDISLLGRLKPVNGVESYFSSRLANAERISLPQAWKKNSHLIYIYELPQKRKLNLVYFQAWMNMHKFPVIDEAMQSEVFFAFNYLTDTTAEMLNNLYRDYLVERAETMMDKREGTKSEQETRDRLFLGKPGDLIRRHGEFTAGADVRLPIVAPASAISHGTTMFRHLSLGPGQRFASKGGYIVRFADDHSDALVEESDWIVP
jgi:hypothetical protein